jgi:hypothetical protein
MLLCMDLTSLSDFSIIFASGIVTGAVGYVLGKSDAKRSAAKTRDFWVIANPRGMFGWEVLDEFRSRDRAEIERRRMQRDFPNIAVLQYGEWERQMVQHWRSDKYWDAVDQFIEMMNDARKSQPKPAQNNAETTILPIAPVPASNAPMLRVRDGKLEEYVPASLSKEDRENLTNILAIAQRLEGHMNYSHEILQGVQIALGMLYERAEHTDDTITTHVRNTTNITSELRAILDEHGVSEDGAVLDASGESGEAGAGTARSQENR